MVLLDTTPLDLTDTADLHWVCVVAQHDDGHEHSIGIYTPHGFQQALDRATFESCWREARLFGLPAWKRYAIAVGAPGTSLPAAPANDLAALGASWTASGVAGIVNQSMTLRSRFGGPSRQTLAAFPGALGLLKPAAQTLVGAVMLLGAAAVHRR